MLFWVKKDNLIAGKPLAATENKTDPKRARTRENAVTESTDKTASPIQIGRAHV